MNCPFSDQFRPFQHPGSYEFYQWARGDCPVFYSPDIDYWVVTRYEDIRNILRDPGTFSADNALAPVDPFPDELVTFLQSHDFKPQKVHPDCDPPRHQHFRKIAMQYLNITTFNALAGEMKAMTRPYIDKMKGQGTVDLVEALTYEYPARVILRLLGEPDFDARKLKEWGTNRLNLVWGRIAEEDRISAGPELLAFWNFADRIIRDRMENPRDDYPSFLLGVRGGDDSVLTLPQIQSMIYALLFAGHETTTNAAGNIIIELLRRRDQWDKLVADPSLIPAAVEEGLRFSSSVIAWRRRTTRPVELSGVAVPQDAKLLICLGSANHDDDAFAEAESFDISRKDTRRHLSFGQGEHFCIGGPLARIELRIMLEELTAAFPAMRLVEEQDFDWTQSVSFRGPQKLLVELGD